MSSLLRTIRDRRLTLTLIAALLIFPALTVTPSGAEDPTAAAGVAGVWRGALAVGEQSLRIVFHVGVSAEGEVEASLDSPDQGSLGIPVAAVAVEGNSVTFDVSAISAEFVGELDETGTRIAGEWRQAGQALPLVVERDSDEAESGGSR